jgi:uncharacterized protein (DUF1330 family)
MAKGYWIANMEVSDPDAYKAYQAFVRPYVTGRGGRFLVRGGERVVKEGSMRARTVVIEFPSYADALGAYEAPEYQEGIKLRVNVSKGDVAIVEGFDG